MTDENSRKLQNTFFWKLKLKKAFVEIFKLFDPPRPPLTTTTTTTKSQSFKVFAKLIGNHTLMANFSKDRKYQAFSLTEMHNLSKGQLADRIF